MNNYDDRFGTYFDGRNGKIKIWIIMMIVFGTYFTIYFDNNYFFKNYFLKSPKNVASQSVHP